jgi:hypothetical protein
MNNKIERQSLCPRILLGNHSKYEDYSNIIQLNIYYLMEPVFVLQGQLDPDLHSRKHMPSGRNGTFQVVRISPRLTCLSNGALRI